MIVRVRAVGSYALNKLDETTCLGCGMLCILRGIINKILFYIFSILGIAHILKTRSGS